MKKQKIFVVVLLGMGFFGIFLININIINVASAAQDLVHRIMSDMETGVPVLFYVFFIKGVNPDCVELIIDDDFNSMVIL